jgi:hypothetical protein
MNDAISDRSALGNAEALLSGAALASTGETQSLSTTDAADRHAAVCAGAVECLPELRAFARSLSSSRHHADDLVQGAINGAGRRHASLLLMIA